MANEEKSNDKSRRLRNEFKELPIKEKIATLVDFEIMTVAAGLEELGECSISFAKKILESAFPNASRESEKRESPQP
jgi:hypothetical protein